MTASVALPLAVTGLVTPFLASVLLAPPILVTGLRNGFLKSTCVAVGIGVAAQVVSDLWHGTQLFSASAAAVPIGLFFGLALYWLHVTMRLGVRSLVVAASTGWVALILIAAPGRFADDPWKYGLAPAVSVLVLAVNWQATRRRAVGLMLVLAGVSVFFDFRFATMVCLIVAAGLFLPGDLNRRSVLKTAVSVVAIVAVAYLAYPTIALNGWLGDRAQVQQTQLAYTDSNIVLSNRPELPQALYLFATHPVLGIGSNASLEQQDRADVMAFVKGLGVRTDINSVNYLLGDRTGRVRLGYASHSAMFDNAVHAGFLGLVFWILLLINCVRALTRRMHLPPGGQALLLFLSGLTVWDAFFSALSTVHWVQLGIVIFLIAVVLDADEAEPSTQDAAR